MSDQTTETSVVRTKCGQCGSARVRSVEATDEFTYGTGDASVTLVARVPVFECQDCGFKFTDDNAEALRHDVVCQYLGVLTPAQIRRIRADAGLTREGFSALTGIGVASLARWETGELIQNQSNDKYLRLLTSSDNLDRLRKLTERRASVVTEAKARIQPSQAKRAFKALFESGRFEEHACAGASFNLRASVH